jgi:ADP-dependent NAD(P)H-hydrate dehydratase / NAD(P)H-hydrate epimerase
VHERFFSSEVKRVIGLCGAGNNGGDTLIALIELQKLGWESSACVVKVDAQWQALIDQLLAGGGKLVEINQLEKESAECQVILDGIFGTGFTPPMREDSMAVFQKAARARKGRILVAVDCPSGVDCTTGEVSPETLHADLTVCMEAVKEGMAKMPAFEYCGELESVDLGIPAKFLKHFDNGDRVVEAGMIRKVLPKRSANSHKGSFGHLIVCGGSVNYPGAPMLAAKSAYRTGTGLVECAIPERIYEAAVANNVESIFTLLEDEVGVIAENASATLASKLSTAECLLLGPGIGREETTQRFLQRILFEVDGRKSATGAGFVPGMANIKSKQKAQLPPMVIDADALRLLAKHEGWFEKLPAQVVLTPHPGEMSALTGVSTEEIQKDRFGMVRHFAGLWKKVVVLKGAVTLVGSPEGEVAAIPFANSILAKAGTGDVLAGIIAGLMAQGLDAYPAAWSGAWIHAQAGKVVLKRQGSEFSLTAGDLVAAIPQVMADLK